MTDHPEKKYLVSDCDLGEEEAQAAADVVRSKWLSVGPRTAEFEQAFAKAMQGGLQEAPHAVAVANCTAALHLALLAVGVGPGDEVLVPSYTFVASANAILYCGATPVFVDINGPSDLNVDLDDLEAKITPRTKAAVAVHMCGFPVDMDRLMALSETHGFKVVEDACHAIGATYHGSPHTESKFRGQKIGTIGHAGCFSFFANKNLVTGEGGMVVSRDEALAQHVRLGRSHGMTKTSWDKASGRAHGYDVVQLGFNYRGTELTAALGLIQLRKLEANNARRRALVARYREKLSQIEPALPLTPAFRGSARRQRPPRLRGRARRGRPSHAAARSTHGEERADHPPLPAGPHLQPLPRPRRTGGPAPDRRCVVARGDAAPTPPAGGCGYRRDRETVGRLGGQPRSPACERLIRCASTHSLC